MKDKILEKFKELFTLRCDNYPLLDFGEDSVRYDFFCALTEILKLKPWEIQLEFAANPDTYILRNNKKSKRKERPMLDLVLKTGKINFSAEFALFRQNSNEEGNINKTAKTVKMMNDMVRLALDSKHSNRDAFFICVADYKMLNHRLRSKILEKFPSDYLIKNSTIEHQMTTRTANFDERFIKKFLEDSSEIEAKIFYRTEIKAAKITKPTEIIIWKVSLTN